jgi:hypothetical protein
VNFTTSIGRDWLEVDTSLPATALVEVTNRHVRSTTNRSDREEYWERFDNEPCGEVQRDRDEQRDRSPTE